MAHIGMHSGIQAHSAGDIFPYIVFARGHWPEGEWVGEHVATYAGLELASFPTYDEAHRMARLFKQQDVRSVQEALYVQAMDLAADIDAERFAVSRSEGEKRQRNDYLAMYGDADHVPLSGPEVMAWKREQARDAEAREAAYQERQREIDAAYAEREAEAAAARDALYDAAEAVSPEAESFNEWNERQLARRALGIIQ